MTMSSRIIDNSVSRHILCLLVLISVLTIPTVTVAENGVMLQIGTTSAQPGMSVEVPISIENNAGISSLRFVIKYDNTVLTLTNISFPKNTGTYSSVPQPYTENQTVNFVSPLSAFSKTGLFATLTFSVNENAEANITSNILVEYDEDNIFDMNFNNVPFVTSIGSIYVSDGGEVDMTVLPAELTTISEEAFMNTSFYYVIVPEMTTTIGSKAFANCSNLKYIYIPERTNQIADDAFLNVTGLTIYGKTGSYAETYAGRKGYAFQPQ